MVKKKKGKIKRINDKKYWLIKSKKTANFFIYV
jgi:hypothetical protein